MGKAPYNKNWWVAGMEFSEKKGPTEFERAFEEKLQERVERIVKLFYPNVGNPRYRYPDADAVLELREIERSKLLTEIILANNGKHARTARPPQEGPSAGQGAKA